MPTRQPAARPNPHRLIASRHNGIGAMNRQVNERGAPDAFQKSVSMIASVMVFAPTAVPAGVVMIAPMATAVIDHWGCSVIRRRFIDHWGGRRPPAKRIDSDADVYVGVGGRACRQRKRDNAK